MSKEKLLRGISALMFFEVSNFKDEEFEGKTIAVNHPIFLTDINWQYYKEQFVKERLNKYEPGKPYAVIIDHETKFAEAVATELGTPEARYLAQQYVKELQRLSNNPETINHVYDTAIDEAITKQLPAIQKAVKAAFNPEMVRELSEAVEAAKQKWQREYVGTFQSVEAFLKSEGKVLPKNELQFFKWACAYVPGFAEGNLRTLKIEQEYFWQFAEYRAKEIKGIEPTKATPPPIKQDFSHYLNEKGKPHLNKILERYKANTKPGNINVLIITLHEEGMLTENPTSGNQTALHKVLNATFKNVGSRQNFNDFMRDVDCNLKEFKNPLLAKIQEVRDFLNK